MATVKISTSMGDIEIELNESLAPVTCKNFLTYVKDGFYNNTVFHRVIPSFMIQGGGLDETLKTKESNATIINEATNQLKNKTGAVAMARTNDPHSATSQFFINTNDNNFLNHTEKTSQGWGYCVFGNVSKGIDVVQKIEKTPTHNHPTGHSDVPVESVFILKAEVVEDSEE